jgi:EAL domain-containing protein (putative c-di-GMP-specific phosphodiesterase class I)
LQRPKYVSQAIIAAPDGHHIGMCGPLALRAAYQPVFRLDGRDLRVCAWAGQIRVDRDGAPVPPEDLAIHVAAGDHLFVAGLCRALQLRDYPLATPTGLDLHIDVRLTGDEVIDAIHRELEYLLSTLPTFGLRPSSLICRLVDDIGGPALGTLCAMLRGYGARVALDDFGSAGASGPRYRAIQPDIVRVDGPTFRQLCATSGGRRMLDVLAASFVRDGATLLVEGIEDRMHLNVARDLGARLLQGDGLAEAEPLPWAFEGVSRLSPSVEPYIAIA